YTILGPGCRTAARESETPGLNQGARMHPADVLRITTLLFDPHNHLLLLEGSRLELLVLKYWEST
ncbi:MAG: hypothetical protein AB7P69_00505, partial [Candidatus Binatia bacterium]